MGHGALDRFSGRSDGERSAGVRLFGGRGRGRGRGSWVEGGSEGGGEEGCAEGLGTIGCEDAGI